MIPIFSQLPRLRPAKVAARHFIDGRSHPSFAKLRQGGEFRSGCLKLSACCFCRQLSLQVFTSHKSDCALAGPFHESPPPFSVYDLQIGLNLFAFIERVQHGAAWKIRGINFSGVAGYRCPRTILRTIRRRGLKVLPTRLCSGFAGLQRRRTSERFPVGWLPCCAGDR